MATTKPKERFTPNQWSERTDLKDDVRRLEIVSSALLQQGVENMGKDALKRSLTVLNQGINEIAQATPEPPLPALAHLTYLEAFAAQATQIYEQLCSDAQAASGKPNGTDAFPYIRAFLMKYKLLLSTTRKDASKPQKRSSVAEPRDYIPWALEARETLLILCSDKSKKGSPLCRMAHKLVAAFRGIATPDEYIDWTYRARKLLLEICETFKEDATLLNPARKLVMEHKLIAACLPAGQKELSKGLDFPFKEVKP